MQCVGSVFFFQAEDGIRDLVRSRGLGDVYKRQVEGRRKRVHGGMSKRTKSDDEKIIHVVFGPGGGQALKHI